MMKLSRGMIKLSYCQAESAQIGYALCLKYILPAAVAAAAFVLWLRNSADGEGIVLLFCAAVAALAAIYLRTAFVRDMYSVAASFLRTEKEIPSMKPNIIETFGFGLSLMAIKCVVWLLLLLPAVCCLREGTLAYGLSGERGQLLLMLNAALCLTVSGSLTALMVTARFGCAEYLFFSGACGSVVSALDSSWLLTREWGGEMAAIRFLSRPHGATVAILSRLNLAAKLTRDFSEHGAQNVLREWCVELVRDGRGEQRLDLIPLS